MKIIGAVLFILFFAEVSQGQYKLEQVSKTDSAFNNPLAFESPDDGSGRIFVAELGGKIYMYRDNKHFNSRKVFLDISKNIFVGNNGLGLLGVAFHPHFKDNPYIYLNYIGLNNGVEATIISRIPLSRTNPDSAIADSEVRLITVAQPGYAHDGGRITFGKDGYLYIPLGDGAQERDSGNNGQRLNTLLGKISRIDVDVDVQNAPPYAIPSDNPFIDDTTGIRKEIYAYGFRNPWQCSFDPYSGALWVGDVGQDRYEEIDTIVKGGNYGWRILEGTHRYTDSTADTSKIILPLWEYDHWDHKEGNCVVGGFVYHGLRFPELRDKYIFGDFGTGRIWALNFDNGHISTQLLIDHDSTQLAISGFGTDGEGNIYVISIFSGSILKLDTAYFLSKVAQNSVTPLHLSENILGGTHHSSTLYFDLPKSQRVSLSLFDAEGRELYQYFSREFDAGENSYRFDTRSLKSGMYFLKMQTERGIVMQKFIVL